MITAGVDVGSLWTKAVVVRDADVVATHAGPTGADGGAATAALQAALAPLGISPDNLDAVTVIGAGKHDAGLDAEIGNDVLCAVRGARRLFPDCRGVLDLGGESTHALRLDEAGNVAELAVNDKCAAGTGVFLEAVAKLMRLSLDELGTLALRSAADVAITSTCIVFAESEVVSLIHRRTPPADILHALHKSIAARTFGLLGRVGLGSGTAAIGGLARNTGLRACLEELLKAPLLVPEQPEMVGALGAALVAAERRRRAA